MKKLSSRFIALVFCCWAMIYSCDNSIDPLDRETGIYAIYGVLDLNEPTNFIRIRDLNVPFTAEATREIDAEVILENLQTGPIQVLESKRQQYEDIFAHNFVYKDEVIPDTEYQLTVERSDGAAVNITITTPAKPIPQATPLNQNCHVPIDFELSPLNGSTVVLRVGFVRIPPEDEKENYTPEKYKWRWGRQHVLKPGDDKSPGKITFTFIPHDQLNEMLVFLPNQNSDQKCGDHFFAGNIHISYIHYSPGFYERISEEPFDIFGSSQRFGALYHDTLAIPVDTNKVCPQDCE